MRKELSEMTLEELWDLFPIFLVQHDVRWSEYFKEIEDMIADLLTSYPIKRISHIEVQRYRKYGLKTLLM